MDTTERFSGLAEIYANARPAYPAEAIDYILHRGNLKQGDLLVDVGCGTGISSRLIASRGIDVIGVEPNGDMIENARGNKANETLPIRYHQSTAEMTGLVSGIAAAILCAQSFHWFEPEQALLEFHRLLKSDGFVFLMWNIRDNRDDFTREYGEAFARVADTTDDAGRGPRNREVILNHPLFSNSEHVAFENEQLLSRQSVIDRAFSASYAPREGEMAVLLKELLNASFEKHQESGMVALKYLTHIYSGRKKP